MKIVLIGATGIIGKAVAKALEAHQVICVGNTGGDYQVNIEDRDSIKALFDQIGQVDAIISTAGMAHFASVEALSYEQVKQSIDSKLLGNVNVFQVGKDFVKEGGSITLTSGVLSHQLMHGASAISLVNAGLDAFVRASAFELGDTLRVNTVSPHFVKETMALMGLDTDSGISASDTAKAYVYAVLSNETGKAIDVADHV